MPSIIDRITETEAQAAAMKREAGAKAREALAEAGAESQRLLNAARDKGREELNAAQARAEQEGEALASEIREAKAKEADAVCAAARNNMNAAVSYILKRVKEA